MPLFKARTKYGIVTGVPGKEPQTAIFKGIPFAKPPVGDMRYHEPVELDPWEGEMACDRWPNAPIQEPSPHYQGLPESEDCLYLNVFTPAESPDDNLPVMVWFYGGGFNFGTITTEASDTMHRCESARYRGEKINKRGVILVCINYRVSLMGFMCHPGLIERDGHCGNYGFLDLVAGMKWVHENIAAFGGNPGNVTIFGQSAGAVSCRMLMTSPLTKDKKWFQRVIVQSGCSIMDPEPYRSSEAVGDWCMKALDSLGLTWDNLIHDDPKELGRIMPRRVYELYTGLDNPQFPKKPAIFTPCLDGYSLTAVPGVALYAGDYDQSIDIMCGTVLDDWMQPIKHCFEPIKNDLVIKRAVALSPSVSWGRRQIQAGRKPVYSYFFERNIPGVDSSSGKTGPYHGGEIAYEFGTLEYMEHTFTDYDHQLSEAILDYWTNFAKNGSPNGSTQPEWPAFTEDTPFSMNFRDDGYDAKDLVDNEKAERVIKCCSSNPGIIENLVQYL